MIPKSEQNKAMQSENVGTRNAVETAIDLSRSDRHSTWDGLAAKMRKAIKPREPIVRSGN